MKEFFVQNWKLLVLCFCALLELISVVNLLILQRKKTGDDSVQFVISKLPSFISSVEKVVGAGQGSIKKSAVLEVAIDLYKKLTGIKITEDSKIALRFGEAIEEILSTPQKKGVKND